MALNNKKVKIGEFEIDIIQFSAFEALEIRKELVEHLKKQVNITDMQSAEVIKSLVGLVYEIPANLFLKLFKNCAAVGLGQLSDKSNFENVFNNNLDGTIELAMEVLELNGFFTLNTLSILAKKIPMLAPVEQALKDSTLMLKKN